MLNLPMQLSKKYRNSDRFGRYYTGSDVAKLLVESMQLENPKIALDLGSGSGTLVNEACRRWIGTEFITVDIDKSAKSATFRTLHGSNFTHHTTDVLSPSLDKEIGIPYGKIDCGLCNPPYVHPKWSKHFGEILESAGLTNVTHKIQTLPADVLFIAQNLRFLSVGGKLGLILSDGLVAGEKFSQLRKLLATRHRIERVIELPRGVFRRTEAKAHIVILCKESKADRNIDIQQLQLDGALSDKLNIDPERAAYRLDYSYLASQDSRKYETATKSLKQYGATVGRGTYSSSQIRSLDFNVFHTTDFKKNFKRVPKKFFLNRNKEVLLPEKTVAKSGDIFLARVGRNLETKVCLLEGGSVAFSDCVFALRVPREHRRLVFNYLSSNAGKSALQSVAHGVGATFITVQGLLQLKLRNPIP